MRLDIYSHNVTVSDLKEANAKAAILEFCRPLVEMGLERGRGGAFKRVPLRTYASATADRSEFRFHANQAADLINFLESRGFSVGNGLEVKEHQADPHDYAHVEHKWISTKKPRDNQPQIIDYVLEDGIIKMITLQPGKGKALRSDTRVKIPGGWKAIGKLKEGDKVISRDGTATTVLGVYPQGEVPLYRITFWDGRTIDACGEHLWQSYYHNCNNQWQVRNTLELKRLLDTYNSRVYVPLIEPEQGPDVELPLDPYALGGLLGGGVLTHSAVTLDLMGFGPHEKFIPEAYLNASAAQRWELLQGLMDIGGNSDSNGSVEFSTSSERLAKDMVSLVHSLGGIAEAKPHQTSYRIKVRVKRPTELFRLPRKRATVKDDNQYAQTLKLRIRSIEPVGTGDATCIRVEHPEALFVAEGYVVTHNTFLAMWCAWKLGLRTVFIFKGGFAKRWLEALEETFEYEDGELLLIRGAGGMVRLQEMALDGSLNAKCIIITNQTMRDYIKDYEDSNGKSDIYPIPAPLFYQKTGIGFRVMDEVHLEFHLNLRQDLYTHTMKSLSLSATMTSSDQFKNRMYDIAYPVRERNDGGGYHVYMSVSALIYRISNPKALRWKGGTGGYHHNTFEQSLNRNKQTRENYLKMIDHIVKMKFINVREEGQKMLVFFASVDMCTMYEKRLKNLYPDLTIARYVQGDKYEDMLNADITVSTVLSAGTAVDIPNLRVALMTTAIDSQQSNEQVMGRTRVLVDFPDVTPEFLYLLAEDIDRHVAYHQNKKQFFRGKVLAHHEVYLPFWI